MGVEIVVFVLVLLLAVPATRFMRHALRRRSQRENLDQLVTIGREILAAQLRLDALAEVVHQQTTRIVDANHFQLGLFDGDDYNILIWVRSGVRLPPQRFKNSGVEGIIGWVRKDGRSLLVSDFERQWNSLPAHPRSQIDQPPRSGMFVPLIAAHEVIGVIALQSDQPDAFSEQDQRLITVLANQVASAIRNAQLFERANAQTRQLHLINTLTRQILAVQPIPSLFKQIVMLIQDTFGYYAVSIFSYDQKAERIILEASSHPEMNSLRIIVELGEGLVGSAARDKEIAYAPDVASDQRYILVTSVPNTRSEIAIPLVYEGRLLGVLDLQSDLPHAFPADDILPLEALAGQLAIGIQEAITYDAERRQSERLTALMEASRAVVSFLNINDLMDEVVDLVNDYFGYDRVHLFLRTDDLLVFRAGSGTHSGRWAVNQLAYNINDAGFIPWVAREGQPLISGDVQIDPRYRIGPGVEDTRSEMAVPIIMSGTILGVFDIQSPQPDCFDEKDIAVLQALADTVAVALRNASLYVGEQRRRMLAETLREVSTVLASSLEIESVLSGILLGLERVVHYHCAAILLAGDENDRFVVRSVRGKGMSETYIGLEFTEHIRAAVLDMMQTSEADTNQYIFTPLLVVDQTLGYLAVSRRDHDKFSSEEIEIVRTFANQAAIAITNAQLYTAQAEEAWMSNALRQVAEATGRATSLDEVLQTVARITPMLVGVGWCAVFLYEHGTFRIVELAGTSSEQADSLRDFSMRPEQWGPLAQLINTGESVMIDSSTPMPANYPTGSLPPISISLGVLLPLYAKGEILGAMIIGQRATDQPFTRRKIELLGGIADQAALAIESAQLYIAQQEEAWVTTALLQVAEAVNSRIDLRQSLDTVVRLTPLLVGVLRCGILQWEKSSHLFHRGVCYGLSIPFEQRFIDLALPLHSSAFIESIVTSQEPLAAGTDRRVEIPVELAELFETEHILGLPLIAKGNLVGLMIVDYPVFGDGLDQRQLNILTGIAYQTAIALETAYLQAEATERQRLEKELDVAQQIQTSFLPKVYPVLPGWEVAAEYRSARQVGGDFYDFIRLRSGEIGIVIADVADKGVPAALFMALSRTLLRASAFSRIDPVETLQRVNTLLLADSVSGLFVTCWYGVLNPISGELRYASAGHNPPLLVKNGEIILLNIRGMALGVLEAPVIRGDTVHMGAGDMLIAYTDGITEAYRSRDNVEFGMDGLTTIVQNMKKAPAPHLSHAIIEGVDAFVGEDPQFDDLTLVIVKRLEESSDPVLHTAG